MAETHEGEAGTGREPGAERAEPEEREVPQPSAEEVPELLGERSDYPIPFGEGDGEDEPGAERGERHDGGAPLPRR